MNISRLLAPIDSPLLADFAAALDSCTLRDTFAPAADRNPW